MTRAVRGAFWTVLSGTGARAMSILGTLAVTQFLRPDEYGEVSIAALVILTASVSTSLGVSQYIACRPNAGRAAVFHATFYYLLFGAVSIGIAAVVGGSFGAVVGAPRIRALLPLLAASSFLDRIGVVQERVQLRDMRFRSVGLLRSLGELVYAVTAVTLAATCAGTMFGGAFALAWAMTARSVVRLVALSATTPWREWMEPHPITPAATRDLFAFGVPMSIASVAYFGAAKFDNFVYSHHFGEAAVGRYNLAYNFADMPAALIAESVGDVLVPSFARMDDDAGRKDAFLLVMRTLVLLVAPLALGLSAVAPELVGLAFPPEYATMTTTLRILALISIPRTILWTMIAYFQVKNQPRAIMGLEVIRMLGVVLVMHGTAIVVDRVFGHEAAVAAACGAVVAVFALSSVSYMGAVRKLDGVPIGKQLRLLVPPLVACVPTVLVVLAVQRALGHAAPTTSLAHFGARAHAFGLRLAAEVLAGAVAFVPSALLLAPGASRELIRLVLEAMRRRRLPQAA